MKLRKSILFMTALWSGIAFAQDVGVTGAELLAGAGDAKLAALGRQAADSGKRVVVSAPDYWHDKVAQKILAGAHGAKIDLVMKDSFVEAVVVRLADKTSEPAVVAAPVKPTLPAAPTVSAAKPAVAATPAPVAAPKPAALVQPKPTRVETPAPVAAPVAKAEVAVVPAPAAKPVEPVAPAVAAIAVAPTPAPTAVASAPVDQTASIRKQLEKSLNDGSPADGTLQVAQLDIGDQIYVDESVRAVLRRKGARQLYWLEGELNLLRTELAPLSKTSYEVKVRIDERAPLILRTAKGAAVNFTGKVPDAANAERISLEKQLNDAHAITETITINQLQSNDLIYVGSDSAVVVRRKGSALLRFWLVGDIDLAQHGISRESNGKYRVLSETLK